jgi:hypothetical protein
MTPTPADDARDEQEIFDTMEATYSFAPVTEKQAMLQELRHRLPTIEPGRRESLIDAIERSIGENLEWQEPEF